jgi:tyrosine phenol-lyase
MDVVAESVINVWNRRREITGLKFVYESPTLRFFTSRFEPLAATAATEEGRPQPALASV